MWGTVGPAQVLTCASADPGSLAAGRLLIGGPVLMLVAGLVVVSVHARRRPITAASGLVGALPVQSSLNPVEMR